MINNGGGVFAIEGMVSALRWTQRNVAAFSGDRRAAITLMGESAGGIAICILLTMPCARGLRKGNS